MQLQYVVDFSLILGAQLPSENQWVGFSGLNMCGRSGWKDRVEVCLQLLAVVNKTEFPEAESQLQGKHCSFARAVFEKTTPSPPTCRPLDGN